MVRSCITSLSDLTSLFYGKVSPPPLSPSKPQVCDLTAIPYASWQPPICPQKCEGLCSHLPVCVETRVNGQLVSAPMSTKILTLITEEVDKRKNVGTVAEPMDKMRKVCEADAGGSGAATLTIAAPTVFGDNIVDGERTPDLSSLLSDDGYEPVDQNSEPLVKKRSAVDRQLAVDWLATLSSLPDVDLDPDDNASMLALYDAEFEDNEQVGTQIEPGHSPTSAPTRELTAGPMTSAHSLPSMAIDEAGYANVDLNDEVDERDLRPANQGYLRPISAPAADDIDVWCEIASSPTVVEEVPQTLEPNVGKEDTEGKKARPLSHVFFF